MTEMIKLAIISSAALAVTLLLTLILGKILLPWLRGLHIGQKILEDGPTWHKAKEGTPTMGGIFFIIPIAIVSLVAALFGGDGSFTAPALVVGASLCFGAIGVFDDLVKVLKKRNKGLLPWQKLVLQFSVSIIFLTLADFLGLIGADGFNFYLFDYYLVVPKAVYLVIAAFFVTGTANATNLTDGLDGLLATSSIPSALLFWLVPIFCAAGMASGSCAIVAAAAVGGFVGFLFFNHYPAKVFMGDTGSLFIGGLLSTVAVLYEAIPLFVLAGAVFYFEALSDMIQVGVYKLTKKKLPDGRTTGHRVFKMAPFHHHLEKCGWKETKIVFVSFAICLVTAAIGFFAFVL